LTGGVLKKEAFIVWKYRVELSSTVNLNSESVLNKLKLQKQQLMIPSNHWTASQIGLPLYERRDVEGLIVPSAHLEDGQCLDVFMDRVFQDSEIKPFEKTGVWPRS
jgi:hypothetical protein